MSTEEAPPGWTEQQYEEWKHEQRWARRRHLLRRLLVMPLVLPIRLGLKLLDLRKRDR